jgi:hydrogenase assembly chaperone HypC/HupF
MMAVWLGQAAVAMAHLHEATAETENGRSMCLGIPGQIVEITDAGRKLGVANVSGVRRPVNLACVIGEGSVEDLIGTWVLIHVGLP